jgi:hypothetical protein
MGADPESTANPMPGRQMRFTYDAQGNRLSAGNTNDSNTAETYTVNALNQITSKENNTIHVSGLGIPGMT